MTNNINNFEIEEDINILEIPKEERKLNTASYDYSVDYLVNLMQGENPRIILEVPFQRKFIWEDDRASSLIESIILNVPIPPIYLAEEEGGKWLVIDGLQRLNSLKRFYNNEFGLKKLEILKEFSEPESKFYKSLTPKAKSLLDTGLMRIVVVKKDSHKDIKFDIFMRLNKGGISLNYQELRNCLYRGNLNNAIKKLVENNKEFLLINGLAHSDDRYEDVEFIIRYFAITNNLILNEQNEYSIKDYKGNLSKFLNEFMDINKNMSDENIRILTSKFNLVIEKVIKIFGIDDAFKDLTNKTSRKNKAIADFIMVSFEKYSLDILEKNKDKIIFLLKKLITEDNKFRESISQRTMTLSNLNYRINKWLKELENAI